MDVIPAVAVESWRVLVEAAPYVLFGFFVAGLLKAFVPDSFMAAHLGGNGLGSVVKAALLGVPLPLCSCGVLPAALGLRRQGAGRGAATAFMIATPETGVDSMAVTWALIDPLMTVIRPVAALVTAVSAGWLVNVFPEKEPAPPPLAAPVASCGCQDCGCGGNDPAAPTFAARFRSGMAFAFGEMIGDIGRWLLLGVVVAGVIGAAVPDDLLSSFAGGPLSYLVMLGVALPLYVCATASTPIAASLLLKGISPGAALVFLLAGPATNGATVTVMLKTLGRRATALYLASIVTCSLGLAFVVDRLYAALGLDIRAAVAEAGETLPHWAGVASALVLLGLVARGLLPRRGG
ncbi:SO_0444 family Cu/Zn efflux transporter [Pseudodesulfovibrio sp.]|uniref:SO_0444 family Cu/Zn efflux transporter n=1 Tax=Pseudodesulfovibrio sp. TaxID=2035812 RepID=UPI00260223D1|nr:SO_0444 family Cu/Zn efflux transporter [Pseudodesulfovibrio sp.]MDD3311489.1 SO_0444 family Cu/Zn efflux transporter [Pseudodesulfovibrio sp.]